MSGDCSYSYRAAAQRALTSNTSLSAKQAPSQCTVKEKRWSPCSTTRFPTHSTEVPSRLWCGACGSGREVCAPHSPSELREALATLMLQLHLWMVSVWMAQIQPPSQIKHAEILKLQLLCPNSAVCCRERQIAHKRASVSDWPQRSVLPSPSNISMCSIPKY